MSGSTVLPSQLLPPVDPHSTVGTSGGGEWDRAQAVAGMVWGRLRGEEAAGWVGYHLLQFVNGHFLNAVNFVWGQVIYSHVFKLHKNKGVSLFPVLPVHFSRRSHSLCPSRGVLFMYKHMDIYFVFLLSCCSCFYVILHFSWPHFSYSFVWM